MLWWALQVAESRDTSGGWLLSPRAHGQQCWEQREAQMETSQALLLENLQEGQNTRLPHRNQCPIPFCGQIIFHYINTLILFICSPADGYLGRFHILLIMNNAVMNIHGQVFVWTCFNFF